MNIDTVILDNAGSNQLTIHDDSVTDFAISSSGISGLSSPTTRIPIRDYPGADGAFIPTNFYSGRVLSFELLVRGANETDYLSNRELLASALSLSRTSTGKAQTKKMYFKMVNGDEHIIDYVTSRVLFPIEYGCHGRALIFLQCPNAAIESYLLNSELVYLPIGGGATFPATFPLSFAPGSGGEVIVTNTGNIEAFPIVTLYGPMPNPYLISITQGKHIQLSGFTISTGSYVLIDMKNKTILQGGVTNRLQYMTMDSDFFSLYPGDNEIELDASVYDPNAYAKIEWRNSKEGI